MKSFSDAHRKIRGNRFASSLKKKKKRKFVFLSTPVELKNVKLLRKFSPKILSQELSPEIFIEIISTFEFSVFSQTKTFLSLLLRLQSRSSI